MVGVAQLVRASGCGPEGRRFESGRSPQKTLRTLFLGFFHLCLQAQHRLHACTQHHLSVSSTSLPRAAQMDEVEALPQMMLQQVAKDVMLCINDVALRANGEVAVCAVR